MKRKSTEESSTPKKIIKEYKSLIFTKQQFDDPSYMKSYYGSTNWTAPGTYISNGILTNKDIKGLTLKINSIDDVLNLVAEFGWRVVSTYTTINTDIQGYANPTSYVETDKIVYTIEREIEK